MGLPQRWRPLLAAPVRIQNLPVALDGYSPALIQFLVSGLTHGFPLHFEGDFVSFEAHYLVSANQLPEVFDLKLRKEISAGRIAGPFQEPPVPICRDSPLGVVPKKTPGEFRLIHYLSYTQKAVQFMMVFLQI